MNQLFKRFPLLCIVPLALLATQCSHPSFEQRESNAHSEKAQFGKTRLDEKSRNTSVQIEYILGRDHYRLEMQAHDQTVSAASFLNRQVRVQGDINPKHYPEFLRKASDFVEQSNAHQNEEGFKTTGVCRTPFTVTVKTQSLTEVSKGCRSSDREGIGRLVREGEFLLYSKN